MYIVAGSIQTFHLVLPLLLKAFGIKMSCPADNEPLHIRLQKARAEDVDMPASYYLLTLGMIAFVAGVGLLYRVLWLFIYDFYKEIQIQKRGLDRIKGLKKLGRPATRNLSKEFAGQAQNGEQQNGHAVAPNSEPWKVIALFNFPIKSCFGIELDEAEVMENGFKYDRQFSFAQFGSVQKSKAKVPKYDPSTPQWEFLTIRAHPALTTIQTQVWIPEEGLLDYEKDDPLIQSEGCVIGSFTFTPEISFSVQGLKNLRSIISARIAKRREPTFHFRIPFNPTPEQMEASDKHDPHMIIWRDYPSAVDVGCSIPSHIKANLQSFLGISNPLTLFRVHTSKPRKLFKNAPTAEQLGYQANVGFQDSYPLSIQNISSIRDMESRVPSTAAFTPDARRYRGNIYISGPPAYDEDNWTLITIGGRRFHCSCRTTRCKLPNTDPDTGIQDRKGNEPQKTMLKYRVIDEGSSSACLGMQVVPSKGAVGGMMRVGDEVRVVRKGEHRFVAHVEPEEQRPVL